jgi:cytochrome c oxidase cbb3-type subunit 3
VSDKQRDQLLNASYDGIQEYDNDLPRWWVYLFVLTIVVSGVYVVYVHVLGTPTDHERLAVELSALEGQRQAFQAAHASTTSGPDALLAIAKDTGRVEKGKASFAQRCAACHGQKGEGLVGPNLTDEYWLHGGKIEQIRTTIADGVPDKGMISWKTLTTQEDMDDLTAFIWSIRNTNVPGKAPQGDKE